MVELNIKNKQQCRWDIVSLGEVMLRLDPGDSRVHTTRTFQVWEGGGEYNVARGLKRCFGMEATIFTWLDQVMSRVHALMAPRRVTPATSPAIGGPAEG